MLELGGGKLGNLGTTAYMFWLRCSITSECKEYNHNVY